MSCVVEVDLAYDVFYVCHFFFIYWALGAGVPGVHVRAEWVELVCLTIPCLLCESGDETGRQVVAFCGGVQSWENMATRYIPGATSVEVPLRDTDEVRRMALFLYNAHQVPTMYAGSGNWVPLHSCLRHYKPCLPLKRLLISRF